jgi:hypothetical protein
MLVRSPAIPIDLNQEKEQERCRGEVNLKLKLNCGLVIALWLGASLAWADSLELKNGSLIKGRFIGGTESEISFKVGSAVQKYNLDGSHLETLIQNGHGEADRSDLTRWCVGIAIDVQGGKLYWTQKGIDNAGVGRIFRPGSTYPRERDPPHAALSKCCSTSCRSPSISISI